MSLDLTHLNNMLRIWNTSDAEEKKKLAKKSLEHNLHFVDPNHNIIGRDPFLKMVDLVQSQIPGAVYSRQSDIDIQNNHCRYHWAIHVGGKELMKGFDVTELSDSGKVVKVIGFFGKLNPL